MRAEPVAPPAPAESLLAVEIATGRGLGLAEAARRLPPRRGGRPVSASTPTRWAGGGVKVDGDRRVRLEAMRVGKKLVTSEQALIRFLSALATPADVATPAP